MSKSDLQHRGSKKQTHHVPEKSPAPDASPGVENASLLELQRTVGNQAVQRMVANGRLQGRGSRFNGLPPVRGTKKDSVYRSSALQIRHSLKHTPIKKLQRLATWAGDFTTDKYDVVKSGGKDIGVDIELRFKPNKHVDAEKFGMTQIANSVNKGTPIAIHKIIEERSIPKGHDGEGFHTDRLSRPGTNYGNPLYAAGEPGKGDDLGDTATVKGWGQHGWHYKDAKGKVIEQDALLKDAPALPGRGANASQKFETTALAVEGRQEGTYYGSVSWGWETDAKGVFTKLPLTVVTNDAPSDRFNEASELWNKSKTPTGGETLDLPVVTGKYINYPKVWMVDDPFKYKTTIVEKLPKNTRVELTDKDSAGTYKALKYKWWKVTAVDGVAIGKVGWVMSHYVSDDKVK